VRFRLLVCALAMAAVFLLFGCSSKEVQQMHSQQVDESAAEDSFNATVTLCRKVGTKSGRRIGAGQEFDMSEKSYVRAFADFTNVKTDRPYTVHLAWIRPDGREMFRKFAEVRQQNVEANRYRTVINWLDAEDLHKIKSDTLVTDEPDFTLETRFNTSLKKAREPGLYKFRVYLDRALLLEEPFTVKLRG
jgi:hypothetical protein